MRKMSDELNVSNDYLIDTDEDGKDLIVEESLMTVITDSNVLSHALEDSIDVNNSKLSKNSHFIITSNNLHNDENETKLSPQPLTPTTIVMSEEVSATVITETSSTGNNNQAQDLPPTEDEQINNILEQAAAVSEDTVTVVATAETNHAANQESPFEFIHTDEFVNVLTTTVSEYSL